MNARSYPLVTEYIEQISGTSAERLSDSVLRYAVELLMARWGCASEGELIKLAQSSADLRMQLIQKTTIKETYFFREREYIDLAVQKLFPPLLSQRKQVRILCAGCSTGAEVYSLAMALLETYGLQASSRWSITGLDIDPSALTVAEEGAYTERAMRGVDAQRKKTFFSETMKGLYTVRPEVSARTEFKLMNIADESRTSQLGTFDIIFYRNVSIYFSDRVRTRVFSSLARRLSDDGALITGASETIHHNVGILALQEQEGKFYFTKTSHATPSKSKPVSPKPPARAKPPRRYTKTHQEKPKTPAKQPKVLKERPATVLPTLDQVLEQARGGMFSSALELVEQIREAGRTEPELDVVQAAILLEKNETESSKTFAKRASQYDQLLLEPHIILALAYRLEGEHHNALAELKKALFIDQYCWSALYYTAELYREIGEFWLSQRHYLRAIEASSRSEKQSYLLIHNISKESPQELNRLCTFGLQKLRAAQEAGL
ncbi:MAG: CheR family methyltransferase [Spirochaetota bacterium]